jgi:outer membrane protein assembly factor BamD
MTSIMSDHRESSGIRNGLLRVAGAAAVAGVMEACAASMPPADAGSRDRFAWSVERFEVDKYHAAIRGLRDHLFRDPLHSTADSARYLLGESYLRTGQELLAANEFRQLATSRPNSPLADDAQLGVCRSYWILSPSLPRDQEYTRQVIEECTRLVEFFPRSPLLGEAREIIAAARQKLAAKDLRTGLFYHGNRAYESAIIYLESILRTYPEADVLPQVLLLLEDSYSRVGFRAEADATRRYLLDTFPNSEEARELAARHDSAGS